MNLTIATALLSSLAFATLAHAEAPQAAAPAAPAVPTLEEQLAQLEALQKAVQTRLLAPPEQDQKRLAEFLKQPDTGLVKLLPREKYDRVLNIRGGGAYYSFVRRTHEYGQGSDIQLQNGQLSCGFAGGDYGYFLPLGDVPIEKAAAVGANPPEWAPAEAAQRWDEFWGDAPVSNEVIRDREMREFQERRGQNIGQIRQLFPGHMPDTAGKTYLLRSVSPNRSDVLVAFRVERGFEKDGSILISWKLLKQFPAIDRVEELRRRHEGLRPQQAPRRRAPVPGQPQKPPIGDSLQSVRPAVSA